MLAAHVQADDAVYLPFVVDVAPDADEPIGLRHGVIFLMIDESMEADLDCAEIWDRVDFYTEAQVEKVYQIVCGFGGKGCISGLLQLVGTHQLALVGFVIHFHTPLDLSPIDIPVEFFHGGVGVEDFAAGDHGLVPVVIGFVGEEVL